MGLSVGNARAQNVPLSDLQRALAESGYDPGPADGVMGPRTQAALEAFQRDNNLPVTGKVDETTSARLMRPAADVEEQAPTALVREGRNDSSNARDVSSRETRPMENGSSIEVETVAPPEDVAPPTEVDRPSLRDETTQTELPEREAQNVPPASPAKSDAAPETLVSTPPPASEPTNDASPADFVIALVVLGIILLVPFLIVRWIVRRVRALRARVRAAWSSASSTSSKRAAPSPARPSASIPAARVSSILKAKPAPLRWVARDDTMRVGRFETGGFVYVGTPTRTRHGQVENAVIDPSLSVAKHGGDLEGDELTYWPNYTQTSPRGRATYLEWLASGHQAPGQDAGYVFLYFYGLEHRFFHEASNVERAEIISEVERLLKIYGDASGSVLHYLGAFLEAAELVTGRSIDYEMPNRGDVPLAFRADLARMARDGLPLDAEHVRRWFWMSPETRVRTPAERCRVEFDALFDALFEKRHPNGLKVKDAKARLTATYQSASRTFDVDLSPFLGDLPDVSTLKAPLTRAQAIADEAMTALDGLSRLLGRDPQARGTLAAHALLPEPIRDRFPCHEMDAIRDWGDAIIASGGAIALRDLVAKTRGSLPDKVGKAVLVETANVLAAAGLGVAPDVRFALRAPKIDEPVILFRPPRGESLSEVSDGYREMTLRLGLAMLVAQADGVIDPAEADLLQRMIVEAPGLSDGERMRLGATLQWMVDVPPDLSFLRKRIRQAGEDAQKALATVILQMAAADGHVAAEEVEQLEKVYKLLGLDSERLYSELHQAASSTDEPVLVRRGETVRPDVAIPDEAAKTVPSGIGLDIGRVAAIRSDTSQVSSLLADIFSDGEEDGETEGDSETPIAADAETISGLDPQHTAFAVEVAGSGHWTEADIEAMAARHGLMMAGAIEQLNEWSFARFERAYLDEYDGYDVDPDVAEHILEECHAADQETGEGHDNSGLAGRGGAKAGSSAHSSGPSP